MRYEDFRSEQEFHAKQLQPKLETPEKEPSARRKPDPKKPDRPNLTRKQSSARLELHEKCDEIKGDFDKENMDKLYHQNANNKTTAVPLLVEDWTLWPPPVCNNSKLEEWQIRFRKQEQPLLKLSVLLNMPVEHSQTIFEHYPIDDGFREPLALFAGAAVLTPYNGARVFEPDHIVMISNVLKELARAGTKQGMRMKAGVGLHCTEDNEEESVVTKVKKRKDDTWFGTVWQWQGDYGSGLPVGWQVDCGVSTIWKLHISGCIMFSICLTFKINSVYPPFFQKTYL